MARNEADEGAAPAKLIEGSIARHLVKQTAPLILGVAAIMSVGVIDAHFVGQLGPTELAAISFIFPISMALSSLGIGVIAGTSSVVSRALGEGNSDKARDLGNLGLVVALAGGILVASLLFLFRMPLFRLMQAQDALLPLIDAYMRPFALGFPLLLLLMGINGNLRGQGAAKRSALILLAYASTNWALDPILIHGIFGFQGFGIAGAAYATIGGWLSGCLVGAFALQSGEIPFRPHRIRTLHWKEGTQSLLHVAVPAAFSNSINPLGLSVLTGFLAAFGQPAVAGFGAGGRLESFAVVPMLGLSGSIGAIVGQNWGAEKYDRVRRTLYWSIGFCLAYGLTAATFLFFARDWLAPFFSDDADVQQSMALYIAIAAWGYPAYGAMIVVNGSLNAIDRSPLALAQSLGRVMLVMVPVAWIGRSMAGEGAVYFAQLAANLAGFLATLAIVRRVFLKR